MPRSLIIDFLKIIIQIKEGIDSQQIIIMKNKEGIAVKIIILGMFKQIAEPGCIGL